MSNYLEQILAGNTASQSRSKRRRAGIQDLLTAVAPAPVSGPATPQGAGAHSMSDGHGHATQGEVNGLNAQFNSSLQRLIADSGGKVKIGSGYRSYAEQDKLYKDWLAGKPGQAKAAPPGKSNHNHGLAADLQYADANARAWVHANASKYGLVFPMSYEPWHIEPIGAKGMRKK